MVRATAVLLAALTATILVVVLNNNKCPSPPSLMVKNASYRNSSQPAPAPDDTQCKNASSFLQRSYPFPQFFPFPPWRIVLEEEPGTCDMFGGGDTCKIFSEGKQFEPEYHVREVIASFLTGCTFRKCLAVDIGANIGYFAGAMAALGSHVIAIERQTDLIESFEGTVCINGWQDRAQTLNAWIGINSPKGEQANVPEGDLGRPISGGKALTRRQKPVLPVVNIKDLIAGQNVDFIKIDIDSIEGQLLIELERIINAKEANITTMIIELNYDDGLKPTLVNALMRLQASHGYHIYVVNCHLHKFFGKQRFFNETGQDVTNQPAHIFPDVFQEVFFQRLITSLLYVKPNRSEAAFNSWVSSGVQVLITRDFLQKQSRFMHPVDKDYFQQFVSN
jgi:FkbM family methyltransferase